jgi:hypothetical protein
MNKLKKLKLSLIIKLFAVKHLTALQQFIKDLEIVYLLKKSNCSKKK